jgi:hypothetical protein
MAKDANYQKNLSTKAARVRAAEAKLKATRELATLALEGATQDAYRQQVEDWRAAQVAAIENSCRQALAAAHPAAYAAFDTAMADAQREFDYEVGDAVEEYEYREEQRRAGAAAAKQARKLAQWQASPAGQKALQERAERERAEAEAFARYTARGCWGSLYCRWQAVGDTAMGGTAVQAIYDRTTPQREAYLQVWPDHRAAVESPDRAGWDALEAAAVARERQA